MTGYLDVDVRSNCGRELKHGLEVRARLGGKVVSREANVGPVVDDVKNGVDESSIWVLGKIMRPGTVVKR
jgi:hypothetical protein